MTLYWQNKQKEFSAWIILFFGIISLHFPFDIAECDKCKLVAGEER